VKLRPYKKLKVQNLFKKYYRIFSVHLVTENVPDYEIFRTRTISGLSNFYADFVLK